MEINQEKMKPEESIENTQIQEDKKIDGAILKTKNTIVTNTSEDEIDRMAKLLRGGDDFFLKVPKKIIDENKLNENDYVVVSLAKTKSFIIETDKATIEEVEKLKKLPQFKDKDPGDIIKEIMFKFNNDKNKIDKVPNKEIKLVEKGSLE